MFNQFYLKNKIFINTYRTEKQTCNFFIDFLFSYPKSDNN